MFGLGRGMYSAPFIFYVCLLTFPPLEMPCKYVSDSDANHRRHHYHGVLAGSQWRELPRHRKQMHSISASSVKV